MSSIFRTMFLEITRIFNHLLAIVTHAIDVGAFTPFLWAFEERENLIEFYETSWGARMHTPYLMVGGISIDILIPPATKYGVCIRAPQLVS